VTAALMMAQQAAADVETAGGPAHSYYTTSTTLPSSSAVKSVRFGQQQALQQQQQQQQHLSKANVEPERPGQEKDALAEATIGLEIAANLALAFARDVRREKLAVDQSNQVHGGQGQPPHSSHHPANASSSACRPVRSMPSTTASPRRHIQPGAAAAAAPVTVRTTGHQQEVTLSEFYQLLQFVSGQARGGLGGGPVGGIVSSDPPLLLRPSPPVSSALNADSTTTSATTATTTKMPTTASVGSSTTSTPLPPPSSHSALPPGYLTARSFRQSTTSSSGSNNNSAAATTTTITLAKRPTSHNHDDPGALGVDPGVRSDRSSITTHRSHSVEVNYDNYLIQSNHQTQRQPPPPVAVAGVEQPLLPPPTSSTSSSSNHALKTRSLPRNCQQPTGSSQQTSAMGGGGVGAGAPVGRHWAEILALITQVLSGTDQYNNSLIKQQQQQQQQQQQRTATTAGGNHQIVTAGATGQTSGQTPLPPPSATPVKRQQQQQQHRRPAMGDSLSDSEEAYLRRRRQGSSGSPTTAASGVGSSANNHMTMTPSSRGDARHYDSLRTPRSSSRASSVAANDRSVDANGGGGHQSYLASLSQRLQIEQYIVKTLSHLTRSDKATASADSDKDGLDCGYIECWGSPERSSSRGAQPPPSNNNNNSNVGLERALLRLDQRMRADRQPRIYQHHHWRITPAECNALFLCKV
jgi:hypothetical protein